VNTTKPIAIYACYFVRYPLGGHVLAELHHIVGLQRLGFEVIVVEESGSAWAPCYHPLRNEMTHDPAYGIEVLRNELRPFGLEDNWCFVDSERRYHGIARDQLRSLCRNAAFLFSRACVTWLDEFHECRTRIYVDTDPGFTQYDLPAEPGGSCSGWASPQDFQFHFSYGTRIGRNDCVIPPCGLRWLPTLPPVVLDLLPYEFRPAATNFTTVMNWNARKPIAFHGVPYGQKDVEFLRFLDLPKRLLVPLEVAVSGTACPVGALRAAGWIVREAGEVTKTVASYVEFLKQSRGEWSVAKNAYVQTRSGWFSERTANYLALGKPAVVQATGFEESIPCGEGLFCFDSAEEIQPAVAAICQNYERQSRAARRLAEMCFDSDKVLGDLLRRAGVALPHGTVPIRRATVRTGPAGRAEEPLDTT
jgi:hypothetical protein